MDSFLEDWTMKTKNIVCQRRPWKWSGQAAIPWVRQFIGVLNFFLYNRSVKYFQLLIGAQASLFTAVNYNLYQPPPGFCFDMYCNDEPIIDDPKSKNYNVDRKVCRIGFKIIMRHF